MYDYDSHLTFGAIGVAWHTQVDASSGARRTLESLKGVYQSHVMRNPPALKGWAVRPGILGLESRALSIR